MTSEPVEFPHLPAFFCIDKLDPVEISFSERTQLNPLRTCIQEGRRKTVLNPGSFKMATTIRRDLTQIPLSEQIRILEELDRREKFEAGSTRRRDQRYTFKVPRSTLVHVKLKEGTQRYPVLIRNISTKGCSILHNSFLYPNTPCVIELRPLGAKNPTTLGMIKRCTLVKDWIHEAGILFDEPVDLAELITDADRPAEVLVEPPFWAEGRKIAARLRASIDARDIVASDKAVQELQVWQASAPK